MTKQTGFTLIELMITIAIIGILVAVALPAYNGYVASGYSKVSNDNLRSLQLFQEAYRLNNSTYVAGTMIGNDRANPLAATLGFDPQGDEGQFTYKVVACAGGAITDCFTAEAYPTTFPQHKETITVGD